ncbi:MAG: phosphoribosyltransferase, partial [Nocardioides sp.]
SVDERRPIVKTICEIYDLLGTAVLHPGLRGDSERRDPFGKFPGSAPHTELERKLAWSQAAFGAEISHGMTVNPYQHNTGTDMLLPLYLSMLVGELGDLPHVSGKAFLDLVAPRRADGSRPATHIVGTAQSGSPLAVMVAALLERAGWGTEVPGELGHLIPSARARVGRRASDFFSTLDPALVGPGEKVVKSGDTVLIVEDSVLSAGSVKAAIEAFRRTHDGDFTFVVVAFESAVASGDERLGEDVPLFLIGGKDGLFRLGYRHAASPHLAPYLDAAVDLAEVAGALEHELWAPIEVGESGDLQRELLADGPGAEAVIRLAAGDDAAYAVVANRDGALYLRQSGAGEAARLTDALGLSEWLGIAARGLRPAGPVGLTFLRTDGRLPTVTMPSAAVETTGDSSQGMTARATPDATGDPEDGAPGLETDLRNWGQLLAASNDPECVSAGMRPMPWVYTGPIESVFLVGAVHEGDRDTGVWRWLRPTEVFATGVASCPPPAPPGPPKFVRRDDGIFLDDETVRAYEVYVRTLELQASLLGSPWLPDLVDIPKIYASGFASLPALVDLLVRGLDRDAAWTPLVIVEASTEQAVDVGRTLFRARFGDRGDEFLARYRLEPNPVPGPGGESVASMDFDPFVDDERLRFTERFDPEAPGNSQLSPEQLDARRLRDFVSAVRPPFHTEIAVPGGFPPWAIKAVHTFDLNRDSAGQPIVPPLRLRPPGVRTQYLLDLPPPVVRTLRPFVPSDTGLGGFPDLCVDTAVNPFYGHRPKQR